MKLSFRFTHGSNTPFETIKHGTAELGSARRLSTANLACRTAVAVIASKRRAIVAHPNAAAILDFRYEIEAMSV